MATKLATSVDFSYLKNATRFTYDDESTVELYTKAIIDDNALSLIFFGDEQFDSLTDETLIQQMKDFANKEQSKHYLNISSADDLDYHLYRYKMGDVDSMNEFAKEMMNIVLSRPLSKSKDKALENGNGEFAEYCSWNGDRYDVKLTILIAIAARTVKGKLTPQMIRMFSNWVIEFDDREWKFPEYIEERSHGMIPAKTIKRYINLAKWTDGHIDWAKIAKSKIDSTEEKQVPPALKKEMARFGLDIIFDETVGYDHKRIWTQEELDTLVDYNFNDVLGTMVIGRNGMLLSELKARDMVRELYPYTSARATDISDIDRYTPADRDATSANLAGLQIVGPNRIRPKDWETVRYQFPVPVNYNPVGKSLDDILKEINDQETKVVDLLEYIKSKEEFIHPYFIDFFNHFRGKDTRDFKDDKAVKSSQPVTHQSTMNVPYYRDGKPVDSYCRVSTGGAHGATCANLHHKSPEQINQWIKTDEGVGALKENKFTVDATDIIHADWSSFYPVMAQKMGLYKTEEGVDRYSGVILHRFKVKDEATELVKAGRRDSPEFQQTQDVQLGLKLVLNAATGAGNMHSKFGLLPLDNKTLSMRLIGNMLIWTLGQRLTQAGAYIISTNTDGLFFMNIDEEAAEEVIRQYVIDYGMGVEPEMVKRFINRDVSTRMEFEGSDHDVAVVGGSLRHSIKLDFDRRSLGENVTYPLISGHAAIRYMADDLDWLRKPYNRNRMKMFIIEQLMKAKENPNAWYHVHVGTSSRRLTLNGERQQKINRVVLTKRGEKLGGENLAQLSKEHFIKVWNAYVDKSINSLAEITFDDLDGFQWSDDLLKQGLDLNNLRIDFIIKDKQAKGEVFLPTNTNKVHIPYIDDPTLDPEKYPTKKSVLDEQKLILESFASTKLGYYDDSLQAWKPIKMWKPSSKIANYPATIGQTLNTAAELEAFNYSLIDVDAYTDWAEQLLKPWKATADVPEIGLKKIDDTVVKTEAKPLRLSKKATEYARIEQLYRLPIN